MKIEDLIGAVATSEIIARTKAPNLQLYMILKYQNNQLVEVEMADTTLSRELYARVYYKELVTHNTVSIDSNHEIWRHIPELHGQFSELTILKNA